MMIILPTTTIRVLGNLARVLLLAGRLVPRINLEAQTCALPVDGGPCARPSAFAPVISARTSASTWPWRVVTQYFVGAYEVADAAADEIEGDFFVVV